MKKPPRYRVPALEKGLAVLETLSRSPVPLGLTELAAELARGPQELFRMCACLEELGYIGRDAVSGKWSLTLKLLSLSHGHAPVEKLVEAARRPMRDFAEATGESCHLSVRDDRELLVVAQQASPARVRLSIETGARFSLVHTASGRLLLALQVPPARLAAELARLPDYRALAAPARTRFDRQLAEIARTRQSSAEGETLQGVRDTVRPVSGPAGVAAALACSRLVGAANREPAIVAALTKAAAAIEAAVGASS